jgi:hypothetical protein
MDSFGVIIVLVVKPGLAKQMERSAVVFRVSVLYSAAFQSGTPG